MPRSRSEVYPGLFVIHFFMFTLEKRGDESVISSLQIADYLKVEIRSLDRLIQKYTDKLELFGHVRFEITAQTNKKVYYLNENQAIFLGTLSKNTETVVKYNLSLKLFEV